MVIELTSVGDADLQVNHSLLFVQAQSGPVALRQTVKKTTKKIIIVAFLVIVVDLNDVDDLKVNT